jgi:tRNA G18 (ribose-2'-O)-methylase SpoU
MLITSPVNSKLKHARQVRDGRVAEEIFVEGERLSEECLAAGLPLVAAFHAPSPSLRAQAVIAEAGRRGCPVYETVAACRERGVRVAATAAGGDVVYSDYDWTQPTLAVFGNEANGVSAAALAACDARLRIPLRPPVESLNVAAAAAAMLFEAARQRRRI